MLGSTGEGPLGFIVVAADVVGANVVGGAGDGAGVVTAIVVTMIKFTVTSAHFSFENMF